MSDLPALLIGSLDPASRKQAEQNLNAYSVQPGFLPALLQLVLSPSQDRSARLAGGIYLKNLAKMRWEDDTQPLHSPDKATLRSQLLPAMLSLSGPSDKSIRNQIAEAVSLIAELDFPTHWPDLIDQLVASLSPSDYNVNVGVLQTAHSIFRPWRAHVRSDELFTEINIVLTTFMGPYLQLLQQTSELLLNNTAPTSSGLTSPESYPLLGESMVLLVDIFYDFTCQDLPPAVEDANLQFFGESGVFPKFIQWDSPTLKGDPDDSSPSISSRIKSSILEIVELYIKLYPEQLQPANAVPNFIGGVWNLIGSNKLPGVADDQLVSQCLRFISTAIRSGFYKELFSSRETISSLVQGVVIPNVSLRENDVEQFEDDPLEFIRLDLSMSTIDLVTRRQAAADVLQALVSSGYETETTEIVGSWITTGLDDYAKNKSENWRSKDSAIYLLTALATRGSTTKLGVTSTNQLVDIAQFFNTQIQADLSAPAGSIHPILQVDAIRFIYTFRNQLQKAELLSILPLLVQHISSDNYVSCTYAAITVDRILAIKQNNQLVFGQVDIHEIAPKLLDTLLSKMESAGTAQKIAENEHLMKCVMRIIVTARQTLVPIYQTILSRLVNILGVISKNPSNPRFDQFIFEAISGLIRFVVAGNISTLAVFEQALFGPFTFILEQDIDQYITYVFQVLAQMLELHTGEVPADYRSLLPFLLTPAIWQQKGSVPGLVRLLKAYLSKDSKAMIAGGQVASVLAVVQQRLIPSKMNDVWGIELLQAVYQHVAVDDLQQFLRPVTMVLLTRMQTSPTDGFSYMFTRFLLFAISVRPQELKPDVILAVFEGIQPGLWSQVHKSLVLPQISKMPHKDRKLAVVGATRLLTESEATIRPSESELWAGTFVALVGLFSEPQYLETAKQDGDDIALTQIDHEEQTAGYQVAYSKLAASETVEVDPVGYVTNPQQYVGEHVVDFSRRHSGNARNLIQLAQQKSPGTVGSFMQSLAGAGYFLIYRSSPREASLPTYQPHCVPPNELNERTDSALSLEDDALWRFIEYLALRACMLAVAWHEYRRRSCAGNRICGSSLPSPHDFSCLPATVMSYGGGYNQGPDNGYNNNYAPNPGPTPAYAQQYQQPYQAPQDVKNPYEGDRFKPKKKINDPIFLVLFILQFLGFAALSGIAINTWIRQDGLGGGLGSGNAGTGLTLNKSTVYLLLLVTAAGLVLSTLFLILVRAFTRVIIHITLVLSIILNIAICVYYWITKYYSGAIIFTIIALVSVLAYWGMRARIPFASLLLQVVMDVAKHHKSVYVVAFIALLVQAALAVWYVFTTISIYNKWTPSNSNPSCASTSCSSGKVAGLVFYATFSFLWTSQVIGNVALATLAGGPFGSWYYFGPREMGEMPKHPTLSAFGRASTLSLGSIAFGSLIVTLLELLRMLLQTLQRAAMDDGNPVGAILACCAACCVGCIENLVEYFNRYAYIEIALYGKTYIGAAKDTWRLFKSRGIDALINDSLVGITMTFGAYIVGLVCSLFAYLYVHLTAPSYNSDGQYTAPIVLFGFLIGMQCCMTITSAIEAGVSTIFVGLGEDPQVLAIRAPQLFSMILATYPQAASGV